MIPTTSRGRRAATLLLALLAAVSLASCDLFDLQRDLKDELDSKVNVELSNGTILKLTVEETPLADLPAPAREDTARGIARFALERYARADRLREVSVELRRERRGPVNISTTGQAYSWTVDELRSAGPTGAAAPAGT